MVELPEANCVGGLFCLMTYVQPVQAPAPLYPVHVSMFVAVFGLSSSMILLLLGSSKIERGQGL